MILNTFAAYTVTAEIPDDVTELGPSLFENSKTTLKEIIFKGNRVTKIGQKACHACVKLEKVNLEACIDLTYIGELAFAVTKIKSITLPTKITHFGTQVFRSCPLTCTFHIYADIQTFDGSVFFGTNVTYECDENANFSIYSGNIYSKNREKLIAVGSNVETIDFPEEVTTICWCAFSASRCTEVKLPDTVNTLSYLAFHGTFLKTLILSKNIRVLNCQVISGNPNLERLVLPEGIEEIKKEAINECKKLLVVILPSTLTNVEQEGIKNCKRIFYVSHSHNELIGMYHKGGFPLKALLQPLKCTLSSSKQSSIYIYVQQ